MGKIIFLILFLFVSCANGQELEPPELVTPMAAQFRTNTAIVTRGDVANIEQIVGVVRAESTGLGFGAVADFFETFHVRSGERVEYGQLLASLDMRNIRTQILDSEERLERLRSDFAFENDMARINIGLAADPAPLQLELELAIERQNLMLRHEEEDLEVLRERYAMSSLYAPFDGVISFVSDRVAGSWISAFTNIMHIIPDDSPVFIQHIVPHGGSPFHFAHGAGTRIIAYIGRGAYPLERLPLTREQLIRYPARPLRFLATSENQPPVGARAIINIYTNWVEDVLRLPNNAIFFSPMVGFYVNRMINGQKVMTPVEIGNRTETYIEIISGVEEGDVVYARA